MPTVPFHELEVYRTAEALADRIWAIVMHWDNFAKNTIGEQLVDAADSIGANIAEGCGRFSFEDNQRFVRYAKGSLNETRHWLRRAYRRDLLAQEEVKELSRMLNPLPKRLNAYLRSIDRKSRSKQSRPPKVSDPANDQ